MVYGLPCITAWHELPTSWWLSWLCWGGTVPSSPISPVPLAQSLCSFFVLRWCLRCGIENMTRDGTPPGPADLPAWEAEIRCHPDGNGPCGTRGRHLVLRRRPMERNRLL